MAKPKPKKKVVKKVEEPTSVMTPEQRAIAERIAGETDDWKMLTERDMEDFSLMENPFKLPPPAQKMVDEKKFKFRWAERKPERIDYLKNLPVPRRWWLCNSTGTPFLKKYFDPIIGAVVNLDQILLFQPYWMFEKYREILAEMSEQQTQQGEVHKRDGMKDDEKGVEYLAGPQHKIGKADEVVEDVEAFDREMGVEADDSGLVDVEQL